MRSLNTSLCYVYTPSFHQYNEEYSQHDVATVTEDIVKGTHTTEGMSTGKVIVTNVLITCEVQHLEIKEES